MLCNLKKLIQWFSAYSELCNHHHYFRTFSHHPGKNLVPSCSHSAFLPPHCQALASTNLLSVSMNSPILDILYKWNQTTCGLLWLASFTQPNVFSVHPCSMHWDFSPFYGCMISLISTPVIWDRPRFCHPFPRLMDVRAFCPFDNCE